MNTTNTTGRQFAIVQAGYAIWGRGNTIDEAVKDANTWLDPEENVNYEQGGSVTLRDMLGVTNPESIVATGGSLYITDHAATIDEYEVNE